MKLRTLWPAAACALVPALVIGAPRAAVFLDGPPPAYTGGFGEPTCASCHFGESEPDAAGAIRISGLPDAFTPGERYRLTLTLHHPAMERGGFELAARYAEGELGGKQAGTIRAVDGASNVTNYKDIGYLHHTEAGTALSEPGTATWALEWTAPEEPNGPVAIHVAANAADGDESQFGDHIYAHRVEIPPADAHSRP